MTFRVGAQPVDTPRASVRPVLVLAVLALLVAACSGDSAVSTSTGSTAPDPTITTTTVPPDPAVDGPLFRVGLEGDITTTNWWAAMDDGATAGDRAVLANTKTAMFELTTPGFAQVPALAATSEPEAVGQQGSVWVVEQPIRDDVVWSDGEPVGAEDLVLYFDVVREFSLGGSHAVAFPAGVSDVSAPDPHTVRVEFAANPALTDWLGGVAMAPFIPAHFWADHVEAAREAAEAARAAVTEEAARAAVAAASLVDADPGNDVTPGSVTADQIAAHRASVAAGAGRDHLYSVEAQEPSSGSLVLESRQDGVVLTRSNPDYFARGTETTIYSDGSVRVASPDSDTVFGNSASGEVVGHHVVGPFVSGVQWQAYGGDDDARDALLSGEVDFVVDPEGLSLDDYNRLAGEDDIRVSISPGDGFRFLAFNMRKPPMSDPIFRRAVATIIDRELVASALFNGTVFPAYTIVHPDLGMFHATDVDRPGWVGDRPMSRGERYETAIGLLAEAGYTWDVEPELVHDDAGVLVDVVPGEGLEMPNGVDVPALTLLAAPGPVEDPVRSTYALWIGQWMRDLGIPVATEPTDLDTIAATAVEPSTSEDLLSWDLHVLGWGSPNPVLPGLTLVALFHSDNLVENGGLNTTGYASADFDSAAEAFVTSQSIDEAARWTREMERIVATDLPYVTLYRPSVIEAFASRVIFPVDAIMGGHGALPGAWPESVRLEP